MAYTPNLHPSRYQAQSPRMQITYAVLEAAKDVGDERVIAVCRRIIEANRIGWRKHGSKADLALVIEFYEAINE